MINLTPRWDQIKQHWKEREIQPDDAKVKYSKPDAPKLIEDKRER